MASIPARPDPGHRLDRVFSGLVHELAHRLTCAPPHA